jgi:hypothetical protein
LLLVIIIADANANGHADADTNLYIVYRANGSVDEICQRGGELISCENEISVWNVLMCMRYVSDEGASSL